MGRTKYSGEIEFPTIKIGRPSKYSEDSYLYQEQLRAFCYHIEELRSRLDFPISARGWCYYLEGLGKLTKSNFGSAEKIINDCRKSGLLPTDICAIDETREVENVNYYRHQSIEEFAYDKTNEIINTIETAEDDPADGYTPFHFTDFQDYYIELLVEKIDLKGIFGPVCREYEIPYGNAKGFNDINSRVAMMKRFKKWEEKNKQCVLLYFGDFDIGGLRISNVLRKSFDDLKDARDVNWNPYNLIIDRFGLDKDFIDENNLTWIDNLATSSTKRDEDGNARHLDNPNHKMHNQQDVQEWIKTIGIRKCEANSLITKIPEGRQLCRDTILKYIDPNKIDEYNEKSDEAREEAEEQIIELLDQYKQSK